MTPVEDYAKAMADYGELLAEGIVGALPGWVRTSVARAATSWAGSVDSSVTEAAALAGETAAAEVGAAVRALLRSDLDEQRSTPLSLVRAAVRYPTAVLRDAGVPAVRRDAFESAAFPDDHYGLTPATLADLDPQLGEVGIAWGAAKAWEHRRRHSPTQQAGP